MVNKILTDRLKNLTTFNKRIFQRSVYNKKYKKIYKALIVCHKSLFVCNNPIISHTFKINGLKHAG